MTAELIVDIIGQIATIATVLLVYLTLKEMEKQRRTSQKPDIVATRVEFYGYSDIRDDLKFATRWINKEDQYDSNEIYWSPFTQVPYITLQNIGSGAAKDIILKWSFPLKSNIEYIQDYCKKNEIPIKIEINADDGMSCEWGNQSSRLQMANYDFSFHEYLMPASENSHGFRSKLPKPIMLTISIMAYLSAFSRENIYEGLSKATIFTYDLPNVTLRIIYSDISGNTYCKTYIVFSYSDFIVSVNKEMTHKKMGEPILEGFFEFTENK